MLSADDLVCGATYRGKRPRRYGDGYNDRTIIFGPAWGRVQYDGPAVRNGRHYPSVTVEQFLNWAGSRVEQC